YIKAGDIYQVNLSQRFTTGFQGDPYALFLKLFQKNPAPFFSFVNAGDHQIISTSPERFIKRNGDLIETRPIKGTMPRAKKNHEGKTLDSQKDKALGEALLNSFKDDAELSMIVDLMRNDLGKVAMGGTVRVKEHKRLEPYDNVFHLVSIVEATLAQGKSSVDIIRATFPGGSITGCPKIRSMEIIDELESVRRHVYTGSVGYISFHDTMDLSIAIRTAVVAGGKIGFSVGGGIVFDSDPEKEYEETLHKGKTLIDILSSPDISQPENYSSHLISDRKAWANGRIMDEKKVAIPAHFTGFHYGAGLFETMRVEKGRVLRLELHLERIALSWSALFNEKIPEISWQNIIDKLIFLNGLEQKTAAVKLIIARGERGADWEQIPSVDGQTDFFALFARPYIHRLEIKNKRLCPNLVVPNNDNVHLHGNFNDGLALITFPEKRYTPLAAHKSLNYLYYYFAAFYAKKNHCDEALVLNANGTVSETNSGSLISVMERKVIIPESDYVLPSVTLNAALGLFSNAGYEILRKKIVPEEFCSMQNIMVLNALMGAVKVLSIDGKTIFHTDDDLCGWLNKGLLITF
ncbi:MAG: chorismate-binding protein, partial [Desulfamplus sp.]|nr:chorismate-binding protein [Desulfamplus sp.]